MIEHIDSKFIGNVYIEVNNFGHNLRKILFTNIYYKLAEALQKINDLKIVVTNIQKDVDETKTFVMENRKLAHSESVISFRQLLETCKWDLPLENVAQFQAFDGTITNKIFSDLVTYILKYINFIFYLNNYILMFLRFVSENSLDFYSKFQYDTVRDLQGNLQKNFFTQFTVALYCPKENRRKGGDS